jgi:hypothetical protein
MRRLFTTDSILKLRVAIVTQAAALEMSQHSPHHRGHETYKTPLGHHLFTDEPFVSLLA